MTGTGLQLHGWVDSLIWKVLSGVIPSGAFCRTQSRLHFLLLTSKKHRGGKSNKAQMERKQGHCCLKKTSSTSRSSFIFFPRSFLVKTVEVWQQLLHKTHKHFKVTTRNFYLLTNAVVFPRTKTLSNDHQHSG